MILGSRPVRPTWASRAGFAGVTAVIPDYYATEAGLTRIPSPASAKYDPGMTIVLQVICVAFASVAVWLGVRIFNRRERWAKWTAISIGIATMLYPLSLGPACWLVGDSEIRMTIFEGAYYPILWLARASRPPVNTGPVDKWIEWYSTHCRSDGAWPLLGRNGESVWIVPPDFTEEELKQLR